MVVGSQSAASPTLPLTAQSDGEIDRMLRTSLRCSSQRSRPRSSSVGTADSAITDSELLKVPTMVSMHRRLDERIRP